MYSDSEYAIETIALRGPEKAALGWNIVNGDLFKDIALCIRQRRAPVQFIQVKGHSGNQHHDQADALAKEGARKARVGPYIPLIADALLVGHVAQNPPLRSPPPSTTRFIHSLFSVQHWFKLFVVGLMTVYEIPNYNMNSARVGGMAAELWPPEATALELQKKVVSQLYR
ncbi:hypothetical protein BD779DRAFT_1476877 [Infundibulicybe gibba]|nr:hypothetical protein BD779DRAFT_1476877 [Infundibulicybe gibba]